MRLTKYNIGKSRGKTILIDSTGHKNLSKITKEIKGIEALMK